MCPLGEHSHLEEPPQRQVTLQCPTAQRSDAGVSTGLVGAQQEAVVLCVQKASLG